MKLGTLVVFFATASAALSAASACSTQKGGGSVVVDPTTITQSEIDSSHAVTAFEAVYRLRPMFLASRGQVDIRPGSGSASPNVYVDDQLYGDVTELRNIAAATVETIHFYNASEAQYKYGKGNAAGVISIHTKH